ncbi:MAG TPA: NADPH-dependent glutamate synthase [Candidatus Paceibacterota bacterium]|nr:NADPH-dependent glutamate synthase [Candidatus Paceibacterota bacterium]HRZ91989.1 NADPH-dependent glutamate synthase [Candidatus Paceibacterota bacterium]
MSDPLPAKERMKIPRQPMPERSPAERTRNFLEVNLGMESAAARREAQRCLQCKSQHCCGGCPVGVKVREFLERIERGDFLGAAAKMREDNVLPAITGRVCPQEDQCEGVCILGKRGEPVAIGWLERFIADYERQAGQVGLPPRAPHTGKKVAIVGSGPAGLSAAGDLVQLGHDVVVLEALHEIGGVLVYGIPEFRLPKSIVREEIDNLRRMGVQFRTNVVVGRTITIDELLDEEGFHAVFIATGAGLPTFLHIPGENLCGVYSANEFLTRVNLMKSYRFPDYDQPVYDCRGRQAAVIGGGNTALDAVRTAVRLGAQKAFLVYRRSESEMPARAEEIKHARQEGVEFMMLTAPVEFLGDERGRLTGARLQRTELGAPDASGRRRPVPVPGSEFDLPLGMAVIAVGNRGNPLVQSATPDLRTHRGGYIEADPETLRTSKRGVFAGGDIVTGGATVIQAMGAGRRAARSIDRFLRTGE